jgi:signal transduction histidine kinase
MFARALRNGSGETIGFVAVTSALAPNGRMLGDMTRTAISSTLLVLLAVMIAVYFISERITSPLREMRSAAKSFAGGQFDARVRVQGKDEVAELAVAFNHMADSLENLEKMRNSFIANVSHDLRTPMTTIAGFIDGIRDGVIPPEERDHYLEVVSKEVHRLSRLVSSLLDLSRIQAGDRKFKPAPFDICEMARLILISFEAEIEKRVLT